MVNVALFQRFQKAAADLDAQSRADRLQLDAVHQQRVDSFLNKQKLRTLQAYHEAVSEQKQDVSYFVRQCMLKISASCTLIIGTKLFVHINTI